MINAQRPAKKRCRNNNDIVLGYTKEETTEINMDSVDEKVDQEGTNNIIYLLCSLKCLPNQSTLSINVYMNFTY